MNPPEPLEASSTDQAIAILDGPGLLATRETLIAYRDDLKSMPHSLQIEDELSRVVRPLRTPGEYI